MSVEASRAVPVYTVQAISSGYAILRDMVPVKTPAQEPLVLPTMPLAEAIAEEWRTQTGKPKIGHMPFMKLAATAIDITRKDRRAAVKDVMSYAASELLCHRADSPEELVDRQRLAWEPVLHWCALQFDAVLKPATGIMPIAQPPEALHALQLVLQQYDDFRLAGLQHAAGISGSLVLGLALAENHLSAEGVFQAAELDALYQIEKNGEDPAVTARHEGIKGELAVCERWFRLLRAGPA